MTVAVEATVVRVIICADARPTLTNGTNGINGINGINGYIYILHGQQCITIHQLAYNLLCICMAENHIAVSNGTYLT